MAEEARMTVADVVANVLAGEHGDFVCEAVAIVARELMEAEVSAEIDAGRDEDRRRARRSGNRVSRAQPGKRQRVARSPANESAVAGARFDPNRHGTPCCRPACASNTLFQPGPR